LKKSGKNGAEVKQKKRGKEKTRTTKKREKGNRGEISVKYKRKEGGIA